MGFINRINQRKEQELYLLYCSPKISVMKNNKIVLWAVALACFDIFGICKTIYSGSVRGTIMPHGSAIQVWIYSGTDTLRCGTG
jgi:TM2 domain-containing membrane protein YozV